MLESPKDGFSSRILIHERQFMHVIENLQSRLFGKTELDMFYKSHIHTIIKQHQIPLKFQISRTTLHLISRRSLLPIPN